MLVYFIPLQSRQFLDLTVLTKSRERRYIAFYFIPQATDTALGSSRKDVKQLLLNTDKIFY